MLHGYKLNLNIPPISSIMKIQLVVKFIRIWAIKAKPQEHNEQGIL